MARNVVPVVRVVATLFLFLSGPVWSQPTVRIGAVIDGPWERNDEIWQTTKEEILTLTRGEFDVRFPDEKVITADWTMAGIRRAIDTLLEDPKVDILLAMGAMASTEVSSRGPLPKPVLAPFVLDAELQGLPSQNGGSGVENLNYLSLPQRTVSDIKIFQEIVSFDKITVLVNEEIWTAFPEPRTRIPAALRQLGLETDFVAVDRTIDEALEVLTKETEAVYVAPLLHLQTGHFERLTAHLIEKKIPSFSLMGRREVEQGILATANPGIFPKITRRIALNLQRILLGEAPGNLPTAFAVGEQIIINIRTARQIRVSPPFAVMTEAVLVNEEREEVARTLNLARVMREAVDKNLEIAAEQRFVAAGEENVDVARAQLLPQIDVATRALLIDADRAEASFGSQPERTWFGTASATQLIFSEPAWANVSIQKHLQKNRENEYRQLRLDIVQAAATAYLNVLRAETFERVQKENLKRTRSNLELAEVREAIGYSGPAEVYRWESEIANARRNVIEANARRNLAEIQLNRLLHYPMEEPFATEDASIQDPTVPLREEGLLKYFDDLFSFKTLRAFLAQEGLRQSPELQSLDALIAAKERELASATRSFFSPTLALQAEISRRFQEGGAGTSGLELPPNIPTSFPEVDETNWSVALNLSLPIFAGGARFAERQRAQKELQDLRLTRQALAEQIEQRIRSSLHVAGASRAGIQLARAAAQATRKNLELVTDAYSQGAVDILDLLDAQNAALNADLAAASAVYDFLVDIFEVERAIGGFYFFASEEERQDWFDRARAYFEEAGVSPYR